MLAGMHANDWDATSHIKAIVGADGLADALRDRTLTLEQVAGMAHG